MQKLEDLLKNGCASLGLELSQEKACVMIRYLLLLEKWDKVHNLTAVQGLPQMINRHLLDSLSAAPYVKGDNIADVGTGAGLPGVPLAIYFPLRTFVLIEANAKRVSFLRHIKTQLGLENIIIVHGRIPEVAVAMQIDQVMSRAFSALAAFLEQTAYLLNPDQGSWLAFKGRLSEAEMQALPKNYHCQTISIHLPNEPSRECNLLLIQRRSIMPT